MDLLRGGVKSEDGLQRHRLLVDLGRIDGPPFTLMRHQVFGNTAVRRKHTRLGELNCTRAAVGAQILANAAAVLTKFAAPMSMKWRAPEIEPARYRVVDIPWMPETPANRFALLRIKGFLQPIGVSGSGSLTR